MTLQHYKINKRKIKCCILCSAFNLLHSFSEPFLSSEPFPNQCVLQSNTHCIVVEYIYYVIADTHQHTFSNILCLRNTTHICICQI